LKLDYLRGPMTDLENSCCFGIGQASRNPERWNWNLPMILLLAQFPLMRFLAYVRISGGIPHQIFPS
jgi:hypothetical protein